MVSGWLDDCLAIHTKAGWEALSAKVAALPFTDPTARRFSGSCSHGSDAADSTARAESCCRRTCASRSASTATPWWSGSHDHAEIWAPERWDDYRQALDDPQELAQAFEGLGI